MGGFQSYSLSGLDRCRLLETLVGHVGTDRLTRLGNNVHNLAGGS